MIEDILIPLVAIGLAEMGDKTQLSILLLSSRTDRYLQLLLGVMLAFFIVDGAAILLGSWITTVVFPKTFFESSLLRYSSSLGYSFSGRSREG
jgi:putative Ca2+/H+ antiporter (TMEM165/GDT1 family)